MGNGCLDAYVITLGGKNPEGEARTLRMKVTLADPGASPGGVKVVRSRVDDEFLYPQLEKPAPGCWFLRIRYTVKKGRTQVMRVEMIPQDNQR